MQQYILSKDNSRLYANDFFRIVQDLSFFSQDEIKEDIPFSLNLTEFQDAYVYLYKSAYHYGYILAKAYPEFTYSEHNLDPYDYQGY
jgi:hypothetical protein